MDNGLLLSSLDPDQLYDSSAEDPANDREVQGIITPEEMAIADSTTEPKIRQLLTFIKWASEKTKEGTAEGRTKRWNYLPSSDSIDRMTKSCTVKGNGLMMGVVGKRCKFYIYTDAQAMLDLHIEIRGPRNEICSEKIMSIFPTRRMSQLLTTGSAEGHSTSNVGDVKCVNDGSGSVFFRQKSIETVAEHDAKKIPFDYQSLGKGKYLVSYVPRSSGEHKISIISHGNHIRGSPFMANIAETVGHLERQFSRERPTEQLAGKSSDSLDSSKSIDCNDKSRPRDVACNTHQKTDDLSHPPIREDPEVLTRTPAQLPRLPKQGTVTRRRVLRRVVARGGSEVPLGETGRRAAVHRQTTFVQYPTGISKSPSTATSGKTPELLEIPDKITRKATKKTNNAGQVSQTSIADVLNTLQGRVGMTSECNSINSSINSAPVNTFEDQGLDDQTENYAQTMVNSAMLSAYNSLHKRQYTRQKCVDLSGGVSEENTYETESPKTESGSPTEAINKVLNTSVKEIPAPSKNYAASENLSPGCLVKSMRKTNILSAVSPHTERIQTEVLKVPQNKSLSPPLTTEIICTTNSDETKLDETMLVNCVQGESEQTNGALKGGSLDEELEPRRQKPNRQASCSPKSPPDSPTLKLLQSQSLHKVCYYISQRAFTHSIPSLQSQASESNFHTLNADTDPNILPRGQTLVTPQQLPLELPVAPEHSHTCDDNSMLSVSVEGKPGSLEESAATEISTESCSCSSVKNVPTTGGRKGSLVRQDIVLLKKVSEESSFGSDKSPVYKGNGERKSDDQSPPNERSASSDKEVSDCVTIDMDSKGILSEPSYKRLSSYGEDGDTTLIHRSLKSPSAFLCHSERISNFAKCRPLAKCDNNVDVNCDAHTTPTWYSSQMFIRMPTPKIDKWTQITYEEIKRETGFVSPRDAMRQRKVYRMSGRVEINIDTAQGTPPPDAPNRGATSDCNGTRSPLSVWYGDNLPQIVYEPAADVRDPNQDILKFGKSLNGHYDVHQWLQNNRDEMHGLQPVRQSTVETVDSGIADSRCSSPGKIWRRHRHSIPNGHRPVCRHPYQGQIDLDPRLLRSASNSPSGDEEKENHFPATPRNARQACTYTTDHCNVGRSNSEGKRHRRPKHYRQDLRSLSDTELNAYPSRESRPLKCSSGLVAKAPAMLPDILNQTHLPDSGNGAASAEPGEHLTQANYGIELTASQSRKLKFRRRSFALVNSDSQESDSARDNDIIHHTHRQDNTSLEEQHRVEKEKSFTSMPSTEPHDASARRRSYSGMSSVNRRELLVQRSSTLNEESYFGFGLSSSHRDDLLSQVNIFSNLYENHDLLGSSSTGTDRDVRITNTEPRRSLCDEMDCSVGWPGESPSDVMLTSDLDIQDRAYPPQYIPDGPETVESDHGSGECEDIEDDCYTSNPIRELFDMLVRYQEEMNSASEEGDLGLEPIECPDSTYTNPTRCRAIGPGLETGTVGTKLFFQVITEGAGNGYLTVGIKGPSSEHVGETSIIYSGDNRYEVAYEVASPGYYAIYVKWSDESIPNSPFITRIAF